MLFESRRSLVQREGLLFLLILFAPMFLAAAGPQGTGETADQGLGLLRGPLSGTVVVLPFGNISRGVDDEWVGAGIAETVEVDLRNTYGVSVIRLDAANSNQCVASLWYGGPDDQA